MSFSLLPDLIADSVTFLHPNVLEHRGIRLLMLDFDNTLLPYTTDKPSDAVEAWLKELQNSSVQICVVSNSRKERVKEFCKTYGIPCITDSRKPFPKGIRQCMERYAVPKENCALVGDQIYTDTLGANCAGIQSILVKAIHNHNFWLKLRHVAELPFIYAAKKRRL